MKCGPDGCPILAFSDLTPAEQREGRKREAEKLYRRGFTMDQISKQFGVSQATITGDLRGLLVADKPPRPKGGRPKGSKKPHSESGKLAKARDVVRPRVEADQPLKTGELNRQYGISRHTFERAAQLERARLEALADPVIDQATLPKTTQEKLAIALRQQQRKQDQEFEARIQTEFRKRNEKQFPDMQKRYNEAYQAKAKYEDFLARQKKMFTSEQYTAILRCLHPDSRNSVSDGKLAEAFRLLESKKFALTGEK